MFFETKIFGQNFFLRVIQFFQLSFFQKNLRGLYLRSRISLQLAGALEGYSINAVASCNIKGEKTRGAFKIVACFLHHDNLKDSPQLPFRFICLFLPEKLTITEI